MSLALIVVGAVFVLILLFDLYLALAKGHEEHEQATRNHTN